MRFRKDKSNRKRSWQAPYFLCFGLLLLASVGALRLQGGQDPAATASRNPQSSPRIASDSAQSGAARPSGSAARQNTQFHVKVQEVQIPFSVYDKKKQLVLDLKKKDFEIYEDGVKQTIRYFSRPANLPLRFGLLIDTSSSTRPRLHFEKEAAMQLGYYVLTHKKDQQGFVMVFDRIPEVIQDFTTNADDLTQAIEKLQAAGGTALLDAVIRACAKNLKGAPGPGLPRRVLIIFSDGDDDLSKHSVAQTVEVALRSDVRIFAVSSNGYGEEDPGEKTLRELVKATGGELYAPLDHLRGAAYATGYISKHQIYESQNSIYTPGSGQYASDVAIAMTNALEAIGKDLTHQYAIGYIPKDQNFEGKFRKIEIRAHRKGVEIHARKGYYAMP